jgi:tetratricopeptide (TPR) repeat protein
MSLTSLSIVKTGALALALSLAGAGGVAFAAAGGGGGGSSADPAPPPPTTTAGCQTAYGKNWEWSKTQKKCIKKTAMNDQELYREGRSEALAGHYHEALALLNAIGNKHDAMVLTMIGYSTRKLGDTEGGIAIYQQALAIDPNNVNTHEYLGEGYLVAGRVDLAKAELVTVQKLCGDTTCEQYQDLHGALADAGWR